MRRVTYDETLSSKCKLLYQPPACIHNLGVLFGGVNANLKKSSKECSSHGSSPEGRSSQGVLRAVWSKNAYSRSNQVSKGVVVLL